MRENVSVTDVLEDVTDDRRRRYLTDVNTHEHTRRYDVGAEYDSQT